MGYIGEIPNHFDRYPQYSKTEGEKGNWAKTAEKLPSLKFKNDAAKIEEGALDNEINNQNEISAKKQDELDLINESMEKELEKGEKTGPMGAAAGSIAILTGDEDLKAAIDENIDKTF